MKHSHWLQGLGRREGVRVIERYGSTVLGSEPKLLQLGDVFLLTSKGFESSPKDEGIEV